MNVEELYENRLVSMLSDYGFKITFANEKNSAFVCKALQLLLKSPEKIKKVRHLPTVFAGMTEDSRNGIYDTICQTDTGTFIIVEMQVGNYTHLVERILFYISQMYATQVNKGKTGFTKIYPVYCVCIIQDSIFPERSEYYLEHAFRDKLGRLLTDKMQIILVELEKFRKLAAEIDDELDELLYTMKNAHKIDLSQTETIPPFWHKKWVRDTIKELNYSTMSPENRAVLNIAIARKVALEENQKIEDERKKQQLKKEVKEQVKKEMEEQVKKEMEEQVKKEVEEQVKIATSKANALLKEEKKQKEEVQSFLEKERADKKNAAKKMLDLGIDREMVATSFSVSVEELDRWLK